jgi:hypothetical protein
MANGLARDVSGAVGGLDLQQIAVGKAGSVGKTAGADRGVGELQEFYIREVIAAVAARNPVADNNRIADKTDVVVADIAGIDRGIDANATVDDVIADTAGDYIIAGAP